MLKQLHRRPPGTPAQNTHATTILVNTITITNLLGRKNNISIVAIWLQNGAFNQGLS